MMIDVNLVAERAQEAIKKAVATERKAIANALCRECRSGYVPTYSEAANYFYHHADSDAEIGCTAAAVHHRTRNES